MMQPATNDLDYLTARLHARRSRMAEAERLDALCRTRAIAELRKTALSNVGQPTSAGFQRRVVEELVDEFSFCLRHLSGAARELMSWLLVRFQMENTKVLLRSFVNRTPLPAVQGHLVSLPRDLALAAEALLRAKDVDGFARQLPAGLPREQLQAMLKLQPDERRLFLLEGALDSGYFAELLARAGRIRGQEKNFILPMMRQESDAFLLMLAVRGKFHFGLTPEALLPLHVPASGISRERFRALLAAPDISADVRLALGRALDEIPAQADAAILEALAWKRFQRLANRAFRQSHIGLGAVVGYLALRRVELANLITLSEGIRLGVTPEVIRARLIPRAHPEPAYV